MPLRGIFELRCDECNRVTEIEYAIWGTDEMVFAWPMEWTADRKKWSKLEKDGHYRVLLCPVCTQQVDLRKVSGYT